MKKNTLLTITLCLFINQLFSQISFDNFANIHSIGISMDTYFSDIESDLQVNLEYKEANSNSWLQGFELIQANSINHELYNSSIFNCLQNTTYQIRVTLSDITTPSLNGVFYDTITTQSLSYNNSFSNSYYVSPQGSGNLFTINSPGNLQTALNLVQAGERIVLKAGVYNSGDLVFTNSGTSTSPITIEGQANTNVVLDGSDSNVSWSLDPSVNGYKTTISNPNCNVVIADNIRLYPHKSLKELKYNKIAWELNCRDAGVDGFFRSGNNNTLRIKFQDNSDPSTKDVKVGKYNKFIRLENSDNIRITNLTFKYYGSRNEAAIVLRNSNHIIIDNCSFQFNDIGVKLEENSHNIRVDSCEFGDGNGNWNFWRMKATYEGGYLPNCSGNNVITDNLPESNTVNLYGFRSLEKGGVFVSGNYSGRGIIVKNSTFHDIVQGLSMTPQSWWADTTGVTSEIDFYNNLVYNCSEDGLEMDIFPRNVRIWNNTFHDANAAISTAAAADGPIYIYRNIFYDFTTDTTWISSFGNYSPGRSLKINAGNSGANSDNTGHLYYMHNTVYANDDHYAMDLLKPSNQTWKKLTLLNNIWNADNQYSLRIRAGSFGPIHSNYNCFWNSQTDLISYDNNTFSNLSSFSSQYNLDNNSINVSPLFVNASIADFALSGSSPLVDAGTIIEGLNLDYNGLFPDIGAIESPEILNIFAVKDTMHIDVYPNPFSSKIKLRIGNRHLNGNAHYTMSDIQGKILLKQQITNNTTIIKTNFLPPGFYILSLLINNRTYTKKIIKSW